MKLDLVLCIVFLFVLGLIVWLILMNEESNDDHLDNDDDKKLKQLASDIGNNFQSPILPSTTTIN